MRKIILPCRGEFGLKIRYHVPAVHALAGPKTVYAEPGEEALYPSADEIVEVERIEDGRRRGTHPRNDSGFVERLHRQLKRSGEAAQFIRTSKGMPETRFIPEPTERRDISARFVVCPRGRRYGESKNWPHWKSLIDILPSRVFAAGAPDSSIDVDCPRAWDFKRFLDASIEAMLSASVVISTDAGLAHLAVLCGAPLLMITHRGLVAPGPVVDANGRTLRSAYWPVRFGEYYEAANHTGSPIHTCASWDDVDLVANMAIGIAMDVEKSR